jgi:hypothetical protein
MKYRNYTHLSLIYFFYVVLFILLIIIIGTGIFFSVAFYDINIIGSIVSIAMIPVFLIISYFIIKFIRKSFIEEVEIDSKRIIIKYGGERTINIPFKKVKYVVNTRSYFICMTRSKFRHNSYFRKGVICSGWFDKRINKELMKRLEENEVKIIKGKVKDYYGLSSASGYYPIADADIGDLKSIFKGE